MKSKNGCPYDTAVAEAAFKVIKTELIYQEQLESLDRLRLELGDDINWFNKFRIHETLGYQSPFDFRSLAI